MRAGRRSLVGAIGAVALAVGFLGAAPPAQAAVSPSAAVVINEVYGAGGNSGSPLTRDFVELYNTSDAPVSLSGWSLQYASAAGTTWAVDTLDGSIAAHTTYVVAEGAGTSGGTSATPDDEAPPVGTTGTLAMSATGGKVALANVATALTCGVTCATSSAVVDLVGWGPTTTGYAGTGPAPATSLTTSISRDGDHTNTGNNAADFTAGAPSPTACGTACTTPVDDAPTVTSTTPADGTSNVSSTADLSVTFSEPVDTAAGAFTLACGGNDQPLTVSGTGDSRTLDPNADLPTAGSCTLTVHATDVTDTDGTPDHLAADKTVTFSTGSGCGLSYTHAYEIQGTGETSPLLGTGVTTQGIVVGDYEGASPALRGFYLQDVAGDGNPATSDAVFVFEGSNANSVSLGDVVRVTGNAGENQGQTQVTLGFGLTPEKCSTGNSIAPTEVTLPFASADFPERYEGMLVKMTQTLTVTEHFQLGRFGEVLMSSGGRLPQPTSIVAPGAPAQAQQQANDLNQILFDDASQVQNPDPILFGRGGQPLSASNTLRGGDTATGTVGVFTYTWGGNAASPNSYRVRPIGALDGGVPDFQPANLRPADAPDRAAGTTVRVAGMNLLNFFNTFDGLPDNADNCRFGTLGAAADCRGADTQAEFDRQWPKTVAGITGTGADVIGINEIENDGYGPDSAIQFLVDKLNAATAPGTYAFIDVDARTGQTDAAGTDAIKVGVLYKPAVVTPVGQTAALNSTAFVNGGDNAPRSRPSIAQAFEENANGSRFVIDVNHLKSKGSACTAPDAGDGSGNCDQVRTNAATVLASWLDSDPTGIDDPDVLLVGDYNSYAMERPVKTLETAGYTNLIRDRIGADAYSYVFDGQWGYLDYAFGTASIQPQVAAVHEWHINSDEPSVLDYNTDFKTLNLQSTLYSPDQFRISDHDPVLVDLALTPAPETSETTLAVTPSSQVYGTNTPATWSAGVTLGRHGDPAGTVQLLDGDTVLDSAPVTDGTAEGSVPAFLTTGIHTLTARFVPADAEDATGSTSDPSSFSVTKAQSTTTVSVQVGKVKGKGGAQTFVADMTASVSLETGRSPVGTVTFRVDGVAVAQVAVFGGSARAVANVSKGDHVVTATFTPTDTDNHVGSASDPVTVRAK
jgi:predicted extracellular nuclease